MHLAGSRGVSFEKSGFGVSDRRGNPKMISEKEMEDQIAASPERFLRERQLTLVSRQLRIGSYIFDLLFQDRHGGKLIVEIQRGTLDREHTYKILDYYDEYRERHPGEFIDVMVVANQITAERKKRLRALGVEFLELSEQDFDRPLIEAVSPREVITQRPVQEATVITPNENRPTVKNGSKRGRLGASAFVVSARQLIEKTCDPNRWELGGREGCLTVKHRVITAAIEARDGSGMNAQIWIPRPENGRWRCTFEIAGREDKKILRIERADSIRNHLEKRNLPECVRFSDGSTVIRCQLSVPCIQDADDDTPANADLCIGEISKIVTFFSFLDSALEGWRV